MLLAQDAAGEAVKHFDVFDIFVIVFTIIIAIGVVRTVTAPVKNKLAIGFGVVSLLVFLLMDFIMVRNWMGLL